MTVAEVGSSYCPHDLVLAPAVLGMQERAVDTRFGRQRVVHALRKHDTCTLLIHGVGATWAQWTPLLLEAASAGTDLGDVVVMDLPGFGRSENVLGHLEIEQVGAELLAIVRALGYTSAHVAGHSMGGFLALDMAARRHSEIESLGVVAGAYYSIVRTVQDPLLSLWSRPFVAASYGALALMAAGGAPARYAARMLGPTVFGEPFLFPFVVHPRRVGPRLRESLSTDLRPGAFLLAARNGHHYDPRTWGGIDVPVWGVFGRADRLVPPRDMAELRLALPRARLTLLDEAAHLVHIEQPRLALRALTDAIGA